MKPLYATQHEARLIASLPEGGTGMFCREVKLTKEQAIEPVPEFGRAAIGGPCFDEAPVFRVRKSRGSYHHVDPETFCEKYSPFPLGAVLAVKEAHQIIGSDDFRNPWRVYPDGTCWRVGWESRVSSFPTPAKWRSGAMMPRTAVRSYIRITGLRVARVQDIEGPEFVALGWPSSDEEKASAHVGNIDSCVEWFADLLDAQKPGTWDRNTYQWLYTFEKVSREADHVDH